jgi:hypothetical protein
VGCDGLGGAGLGLAARLPRVLDARVLDAGAGPVLHVVAGDGEGPARLYRFPE